MSKQINLFNPALLKQKAIFTTVTMAQALALLLVGAAALVAYGRHSVAELEREAAAGAERLALRKNRQAIALVEFAPRAKRVDLEQEIAEAEAQQRSLRLVADVLQRGEFGNTTGYAEYFRALARQSAGDLWLTGVSINGAGRQIGLQGRALEPNLVPAYIGRLRREPVMQGKSFGSLQISSGAKTDKDGKEIKDIKDIKDEKAEASAAPYVEFSLQAERTAAGAEVVK
ncbi:MAG: PilN domain-containing protein [Massilia sp.]